MVFCEPSGRIYQRRALAAIGVYSVVFVGVAVAFAHNLVPPALTIPVAVLPIVPAAFVLPAILARLRTMDELQRRIQYEAIAFAFGVTALGSLAFGCLQEFANFPDANWVWVWPVLGAAWSVGMLVSRRRYR